MAASATLKKLEGEISLDDLNTEAPNDLVEENEKLKQEINELMQKVSEGSIILPHGTKEKIRDLEEMLMKEVDTTEVEEPRVVDENLVLTHNNNNIEPNEKDQVKTKESNVIKGPRVLNLKRIFLLTFFFRKTNGNHD